MHSYILFNGSRVCVILQNKLVSKFSKNNAANSDHYPRAEVPILGYDSPRSTTTTKLYVDSAALRGCKIAWSSYFQLFLEQTFHQLFSSSIVIVMLCYNKGIQHRMLRNKYWILAKPCFSYLGQTSIYWPASVLFTDHADYIYQLFKN